MGGNTDLYPLCDLSTWPLDHVGITLPLQIVPDSSAGKIVDFYPYNIYNTITALHDLLWSFYVFTRGRNPTPPVCLTRD